MVLRPSRLLLSLAAALLSATGTMVVRSAAQPRPAQGTIRIAAQNPVGIAAASGRLWVTDAGTGEVLELDPANGLPTGKFKLAVTQPKGLAFDGQRLWVADQ